MLTTVGGHLDLYECGSLVNVDGFGALTTIGGDLTLYECESLENVDGFSALTTISGRLDLCACESLVERGLGDESNKAQWECRLP